MYRYTKALKISLDETTACKEDLSNIPRLDNADSTRDSSHLPKSQAKPDTAPAGAKCAKYCSRCGKESRIYWKIITGTPTICDTGGVMVCATQKRLGLEKMVWNSFSRMLNAGAIPLCWHIMRNKIMPLRDIRELTNRQYSGYRKRVARRLVAQRRCRYGGKNGLIPR